MEQPLNKIQSLLNQPENWCFLLELAGSRYESQSLKNEDPVKSPCETDLGRGRQTVFLFGNAVNS